jgi:hypothetical protein
MSQPIRITPVAGLDMDNDLLNVGGGSYTDAFDIRTRDNTGSDNNVVLPVKGNGLGLTLPQVTQTTGRKYRIYIQKDLIPSPAIDPDARTGTLTIIDEGMIPFAGTSQLAMDFTDYGGPLVNFSTISAYFTQIKLLIDDATNGLYQYYGAVPFTYSTLTTTGSNSGYFDVTSAAIVDFDWGLAFTGNVIQRIELIQEYFDKDEDLKPIGSVDMGGEIFLVSATRNNYYQSTQVVEIGVIEFNENTEAYSYKRLLRSRQLGFSQEFRVQMSAERIGNKVFLYMTDRNTKPRVVEVDRLDTAVAGSHYVQDSCLSVNGGRYDLQSIDSETYFFLKSPACFLEFNSVIEGGGRLSSGNKRYSGRFITEDLIATELIPFTNPVPVYPATISKPSKISGGIDGEVTDKSVRLLLDNIPQGVYKFFELVAVEYIGDSFTAKVVRRYNLTESTTTLQLEHTGVGEDDIPLGTNEIAEAMVKYSKIESFAIHHGRMFVAGCKEQADLDLTTWAETITHSLENKELDSVGVLDSTITSLTNSEADYKYGEYQVPVNVNRFGSHMFMETYRYGIRVRWKDTGKWSRAYWVDDITIDGEASSYSGRRTANNVKLNFTNAANTKTNSFFVRFAGINLQYIEPTTGEQLFRLIDAYEIVRADVDREVIATGVFLPGESVPGTPNTVWPHTYSGTNAFPTGSRVNSSNFAFGFCPDIMLGSTDYEFESGDQLFYFGAPARSSTSHYFLRSKVAGFSSYRDQYGYFGVNGAYPTLQRRTITDYYKLRDGASQLSTSGADKISLADGNLKWRPDVVFELASAITTPPTNGFYYGVIFRDKGGYQKYNKNKELTQYHSCNAQVRVDDNYTTSSLDVYGDVYTQKTHTQLAQNSYIGEGIASSFYSQNVANTQLRKVKEHDGSHTGPGYLFPQYVDNLQTSGTQTYVVGTIGNGLAYWIEQWPEVTNQNAYDTGYNFNKPPLSEAGYDENDDYDGNNPVRVAYSQRKQSGSEKNNYRIFKPADFIDLDATHGAISHIASMNGALYSWQLNSFRRLYSNETSLTTDPSGIEVVLGTGGILPNTGQELSSIGTDKKWSIVVGKTPNGKTTAYWYNDQLRRIIRFGADGTKVISDMGIRSFLLEDADFLRSYSEPITGYGVHGVWNDRHNEAIFTMKSFNFDAVRHWGSAGAFNQGDLGYTLNSKGPDGLPYIYVAKSTFTVSGDEYEPGVGEDWEDFWTGPFGVESYPAIYTRITIVWDELANRWRSQHSYWPDMYISHINNFLSPNPANQKQIYVHDKTGYATYYGNTYEPFVTSVLNWEPNVTKYYEAVQSVSDLAPYKILFATSAHQSDLEDTDFETREDYHYAAIQNTGVPGSTTGDTSRLFGRYLLSTFVFENNVYQRLNNYIVKVRPSPRLYNR